MFYECFMNEEVDFDDDLEDDFDGSIYRLKASVRAMHDVLSKYNLDEEVEALYEKYFSEEKEKHEKRWAERLQKLAIG
jgi:hypothetical protein